MKDRIGNKLHEGCLVQVEVEVILPVEFEPRTGACQGVLRVFDPDGQDTESPKLVT
jgi:hypothetical protein